jgi:hypothetical protein
MRTPTWTPPYLHGRPATDGSLFARLQASTLFHHLLCFTPADFNLDFYTHVQDLGYLVAAMGGKPFSAKFK